MTEPEVVGPISPKGVRWTGIIQPGEVRNPSGTNGLTILARKIKAATGNGDLVIKTLLEAIADENPVVRLKACELLLKHGWGVPKDEIRDGDAARRPQFDPSKLTPEQLTQLEAFLRLMSNGQ